MRTEGRCLIHKLRNLSQQELAAVEDFVEFLSQREDRQLTQAAGRLTKKALHKVWDQGPHVVPQDVSAGVFIADSGVEDRFGESTVIVCRDVPFEDMRDVVKITLALPRPI